VEEYATLNDVKLGRKGPGRRGSSEKYLMINRDQMAGLLGQLDAYDLAACSHDTLAALLGQVKQDLRLLGTEPVSGVLDGVFESMPSLAKELGKAAPKLVVIDHGVHVRNQATDLLRNVFMHLYRNALDHGIEMPDDRLCAGKEASGLIQLETELVGEHLNMCLKDDGKGLALGRIRQKAMEKGLLGENDVRSDEAVANLIFAAGFSTATTVTEVSGRGVGMDAVQDFIKREGGSIQLELIDDAEGADFRAFVTRLTLPAQLAVAASSSSPMHRADGSGVADETRSDHGLASPILAPAYGAA
jgi:chemotaxis protein histidine kinase CheA